MVRTSDSNRSNDEIDLFEILLKVILIIRDYFWIIVIFLVLGAGLGMARYLTTKKQYESRMIISSNILTTSYAKVLFDNANRHRSDEDFEVLAKDLSLDLQSAQQIASLQIENLSKAEGDDLQDADRYLITAIVYEQSILPALQKGIISYLEQNEFVKVRVEQQKNFMLQMISAVEKELADLEQFKSEIHSGKFFSNTKGNVMFDPTTVNTKLLDLTQKRIELKNSLQLSNSVQLIEGFSAFKHHIKPSMVTSIVAGSVIGLFGVAIIMALNGLRHLLRMAESNSTTNAA